MNNILQELFNPPVDKQDLTEKYDEGESWKVDNGIASGPSKSSGQSAIDYHMNWRKKHQSNN